jgi:cytochrome c oxidase subunit 3
VLAWRQLTGTGYFLTSNPASSFFYLITALHGIHLVGGVVALAGVAAKAWRGSDPAQARLSLDLCSMYWDFLLLMWLVLFALLLTT